MHNRGWTQTTVGASLLAMTVGQMKGLCLTDRYREQAHSYRVRCRAAHLSKLIPAIGELFRVRMYLSQKSRRHHRDGIAAVI